jgi:hypothetical protein
MKISGRVFVALSLAILLFGVAGATAKNLVSFVLDQPMTIGGKTVGPGKCEVTWVIHSPETDVTFTLHGKVRVEAHGRMVEKDTKADYNGLVTVKDGNGNDVLKEIRFAGKKSAIVIE